MTRSAKVGEDVKLAPLIGIDGATEGKIRRIVVADDAAGADLRHLGAGSAGGKCRVPVALTPAVVNGFYLRAAEAVLDIVVRASSCHHITNALFIYTVILLCRPSNCKFAKSDPMKEGEPR